MVTTENRINHEVALWVGKHKDLIPDLPGVPWLTGGAVWSMLHHRDPRDLDFIITGSFEEYCEWAEQQPERTSLGGVKGVHNGMAWDAWHVRDSHAMRVAQIPVEDRTVDVFLKSTPFAHEAVAVSMWARSNDLGDRHVKHTQLFEVALQSWITSLGTWGSLNHQRVDNLGWQAVRLAKFLKEYPQYTVELPRIVETEMVRTVKWNAPHYEREQVRRWGRVVLEICDVVDLIRGGVVG